MLETKRLFAAGLTLAWLAAVGCYDFDKAFDECVATGHCKPEGCDPQRVDLPDDFFHDDNCDGIDGDPTAALFVDPVLGSDSNAGTPNAPFQTLSHALPYAADAGKALYLAQGNYDEALTLDTPVSLHGGYSGLDGGWARGADYTTLIGGGSIGLTVRGLGGDAGVVLERLRIESVQPPDAGAPSIGLRVVESGVRLRHVQVVAGRGAPGAPGTSPGATTQGGADGGEGQTAVQTSPRMRADGGVPGLGSCGEVLRPGGHGGFGGHLEYPATNGLAGTPSADGGLGGASQNLPVCDGGSDCFCTGLPGENGRDGLAGAAGEDGPPGDNLGQLKEGSWVASTGASGGPGSYGEGGGGGGGGGFCRIEPFSSAEGGGGGGGGAGGCPGTGASGGGGGGASIAVLLLQGHLTLEHSTLMTTGGGPGGRGGTGGAGGPGGKGGAGGKGYTYTYDLPPKLTSTGGTGGNGGNGGQGGRGGHGGNGGGGPSVGVWCDPDSSLSEKGSTFNLGPSGQPGDGPGRKTPVAAPLQSHQCTPVQ